MRDKQHYLSLLASNPTASVGTSLAASSVYAARYGLCEAEHRGDEWKAIYRELAGIYGEYLSPDEVRGEMEGPDDLITISEAAKVRGVSTQAISQAVQTGRLRGYTNPAAPQRQGRTLVSRRDVEQM